MSKPTKIALMAAALLVVCGGIIAFISYHAGAQTDFPLAPDQSLQFGPFSVSERGVRIGPLRISDDGVAIGSRFYIGDDGISFHGVPTDDWDDYRDGGWNNYNRYSGSWYGKDPGALLSDAQELNSFQSIDLSLDLYDIEVRAEGDRFSLSYDYFENIGKPSIEVARDTLIIRERRHADDYKYPNGKTPKLVLTYPAGTEFSDVSVSCDLGSLKLPSVKARAMDLSCDLGSIDLSDAAVSGFLSVSCDSGDAVLDGVTADRLNISCDLGDLTLRNAQVTALNLSCDTGQGSLSNVTAGSAELSCDMGGITAKGLSTNGLDVSSDAGTIELQGTFLGRSFFSTDLGTITVKTTEPKSQYAYEVQVDMGSVTIGGQSVSFGHVSQDGGPNYMEFDVEMGSAEVIFGK